MRILLETSSAVHITLSSTTHLIVDSVIQGKSCSSIPAKKAVLGFIVGNRLEFYTDLFTDCTKNSLTLRIEGHLFQSAYVRHYASITLATEHSIKPISSKLFCYGRVSGHTGSRLTAYLKGTSILPQLTGCIKKEVTTGAFSIKLTTTGLFLSKRSDPSIRGYALASLSDITVLKTTLLVSKNTGVFAVSVTELLRSKGTVTYSPFLNSPTLLNDNVLSLDSSGLALLVGSTGGLDYFANFFVNPVSVQLTGPIEKGCVNSFGITYLLAEQIYKLALPEVDSNLADISAELTTYQSECIALTDAHLLHARVRYLSIGDSYSIVLHINAAPRSQPTAEVCNMELFSYDPVSMQLTYIKDLIQDRDTISGGVYGDIIWVLFEDCIPYDCLDYTFCPNRTLITYRFNSVTETLEELDSHNLDVTADFDFYNAGYVSDHTTRIGVNALTYYFKSNRNTHEVELLDQADSFLVLDVVHCLAEDLILFFPSVQLNHYAPVTVLKNFIQECYIDKVTGSISLTQQYIWTQQSTQPTSVQIGFSGGYSCVIENRLQFIPKILTTTLITPYYFRSNAKVEQAEFFSQGKQVMFVCTGKTNLGQPALWLGQISQVRGVISTELILLDRHLLPDMQDLDKFYLSASLDKSLFSVYYETTNIAYFFSIVNSHLVLLTSYSTLNQPGIPHHKGFLNIEPEFFHLEQVTLSKPVLDVAAGQDVFITTEEAILVNPGAGLGCSRVIARNGIKYSSITENAAGNKGAIAYLAGDNAYLESLGV